MRMNANTAIGLVAAVLIVGAVAPGTLQDRFGGPGVPSFAPGGQTQGMAGDRLPPGTVVRVVDGDTIRVRVEGFDTTVRLLGVDTPETVHPRRPVECYGPEATALARRLLPPGAKVTLETDRSQATRDRYGRLLAYVYRGSDTGPASVNRQLLANGAARLSEPGGPVWFTREFRAAEQNARAKRLGLWRAC